jgi:hypothetical protein
MVKFLRSWWDRVSAWAAIGVGVIALLIGYFGVSGTPYVAKQLPYFISGGLFGIFMLGIGAMLWLSADLRDEWRELRDIKVMMSRREPLPSPPASPTPAPTDPPPSSESSELPSSVGERSDLVLATPAGERGSNSKRPRQSRRSGSTEGFST